MNEIVRNKLIEVASKKKIIHYQQLCDACNLGLNMYNYPQDRIMIGDIIGEILTFEYRQHRPLLSAIVLTQDGNQGDGFYKLCERLGITADWKSLKRDDTFAIREIAKCHDYWSSMVNLRR